MAKFKHGSMKIDTQEKTFDGFVGAVKWAVILIICTLIFMAMVNA